MTATFGRLAAMAVLVGSVALAIAAPVTLPTSRPASRPATGPATRLGAVPKALIERIAALKNKRADAVAFAKTIDADGIKQARDTFNELKRETAAVNAALAPFADASAMKYPSAMPKPTALGGAGEAIWFYKACRAIEKYNDANRGGEDGPSYAVQKLTNEYREALGLMPLEIDERLVDAARGHSSWMAQSGLMEHDEDVPGEKTPAQRIRKAGYVWHGCGENIAQGHPTAQMVFEGWFNSSHHHQNLVGNYTHLGVANVQNNWTQNFAIGEGIKAGR